MATYERIKKFGTAVVLWLRSDATLVTLSSHTSGDLRIVMEDLTEDRKVPSVTVALVGTGNAVPDCDTLYETDVLITAYADTRIGCLDLLGRVHAFAQPTAVGNRTVVDPVISTASVVITRCRTGPLRTDFASSMLEPNLYVANMSLSMWWRDAA